jgi:hypothetical protein
VDAQSGERPPAKWRRQREINSSEGIAKPRRPRAGPANWRQRRPRHRWSPLALKGETGRALPVVIPVAVAGTIGIVAAMADLIADPPPPSVLAGVAALLLAATVAEAFPLPVEGVNVGTRSRSFRSSRRR